MLLAHIKHWRQGLLLLLCILHAEVQCSLLIGNEGVQLLLGVLEHRLVLLHHLVHSLPDGRLYKLVNLVHVLSLRRLLLLFDQRRFLALQVAHHVAVRAVKAATESSLLMFDLAKVDGVLGVTGTLYLPNLTLAERLLLTAIRVVLGS